MNPSSGHSLEFKRAAITGASGFVGTHLLNLLIRQGIHVRALFTNPTSSAHCGNDNTTVHYGDVRDHDTVAQLLSDVDIVFHTAGLVTPWTQNPTVQHEINAEGTRIVVHAASARGIPAVCTSSIIALDPFPPPFLVRLLDGNHYVKSKRNALSIIRAARNKGAKISTILPSGIVGPMDRRPTALGKQVMAGVRQKHPRLSFSGGLYLVDVRDVAEAHILAAQNDYADYVIPGEYWSLDQFYGCLSKLSGGSVRLLRVPIPLVTAVSSLLALWSRIWTGRPPIITPAWVYYFKTAVNRSYPDDSGKLGLKLRPVQQSIEDAFLWFERHGY